MVNKNGILKWSFTFVIQKIIQFLNETEIRKAKMLINYDFLKFAIATVLFQYYWHTYYFSYPTNEQSHILNLIVSSCNIKLF